MKRKIDENMEDVNKTMVQPLYYDNPAFKFKHSKIDNRYQQPNNTKEDEDHVYNEGDIITGYSKVTKKKHTGTIVEIETDEDGEVLWYIIQDKESQKRVKVSAEDAQKEQESEQTPINTNSFKYYNESKHVKSWSEFFKL